MMELEKLLEETLYEGLEQMILSNSVNPEAVSKIKIRPVLLKGELLFQETQYRNNQVFHANYTKNDMKEQLLSNIGEHFRQLEVATLEEKATVLVSKKGRMTVKRKRIAAEAGKDSKTSQTAGVQLQHDRKKQYILEEGRPVEFLVGLGVQTKDGRIVKSRYDKFKQINRYLEFIEDVLQQLPKDRTVRIVDFGCGKSYLTFAMYYYLHELQGYDVSVTGLDLKEDVIKLCNRLAEEYHYDGLRFEQGNISSYEGETAVDMVVSLHACDTATDYALEKAVKWGARVILAVPCCQHEVNRQIQCTELQKVLKYGVIKERISALVTDAVRANLLEQQGYDTQILEFIDMEHTPKNLLIRAVRKEGMHKKTGEINELTDFLHIRPTLLTLLENENGGCR